MRAEHDVVDGDLRRDAAVCGEGGARGGEGVEEGGVERVRAEAGDVQDDEVERQAAHGAEALVEEELRVEGRGPRGEVRPAAEEGEQGDNAAARHR